MAIAETVRERTRSNPKTITAVLSVVGYVFVIGAFAGVLPIPELGRGTVLLLGDLIAVVNSVALTALLAGWWFIRRGDVRRHRAAMLTAFALILLFLVLYLLKIGGGFEKAILATGVVRGVYLAMLAVHILLSVLAVPVVIHAVVLGLTHSPSELPETSHPTVGRVAAWAWSLSLALGVVTYVLLNHVYGWEPMETAILAAVALPRRWLDER